jgi:transposase
MAAHRPQDRGERHSTFPTQLRSHTTTQRSTTNQKNQATTPEQHAMPGTVVGVDRGVRVAAVTSDGAFFDRPFITAGEAVRYRRLQ